MCAAGSRNDLIFSNEDRADCSFHAELSSHPTCDSSLVLARRNTLQYTLRSYQVVRHRSPISIGGQSSLYAPSIHCNKILQFEANRHRFVGRNNARCRFTRRLPRHKLTRCGFRRPTVATNSSTCQHTRLNECSTQQERQRNLQAPALSHHPYKPSDGYTL